MTKGTKNKAKAPVEKEPKKNPLLDADEETSDESQDSSQDSDEVTELDEPEEEEQVEEAPKKAPSAPSKPEEKPVEKVNVASEMLSDIARTKKILDAEEKISFYVPLFEGEKPGSIHQCFINGYMVPVKKGVMTLVPRSIAEMLANHFKINSEAGADFRLDNDERKQQALS